MKEEIVDKYSIVDTLDMCMEEAGELVHALNKYKRASGLGYETKTSENDALLRLTQAIADAQNAINSVMYVIGIDEKEIIKEITRADKKMMDILNFEEDMKNLGEYLNREIERNGGVKLGPKISALKSEKVPEKQGKNEFYSEKCSIKNNDAYPETYWIDKNNHDAVNHPSHYCIGGIECIDVIKATSQGMDGIEAFCHGNAMKYLFRWKQKNGVEDLKKARWYIDKLIEIQENSVNKNKE